MQINSVGGMAQAAIESPFCAVCNQESENLFVCGRCRRVTYCGRECQKQAWPAHKLICKVPISTSVECKAISLDGKSAVVNVSHMVSERESDSQTAIQEGINHVSSRLRNPIAVSIRGTEDTVAYVSLGNAIGQSARKEGYNGFEGCSTTQVLALAEAQKYIPLIKTVRTEANVEAIIAFLQPLATQGHAILMLELSRALLQQAEAQKGSEKALNIVKEGVGWFIKGMHTVELDLACITDQSCSAALDVLSQTGYHPNMVAFSVRAAVGNMFAFRKEILKNWEPPIHTTVSPGWLSYHSLGFLLGTLSLLPKEDWPQARQQKHSARILEL